MATITNIVTRSLRTTSFDGARYTTIKNKSTKRNICRRPRIATHGESVFKSTEVSARKTTTQNAISNGVRLNVMDPVIIRHATTASNKYTMSSDPYRAYTYTSSATHFRRNGSNGRYAAKAISVQVGFANVNATPIITSTTATTSVEEKNTVPRNPNASKAVNPKNARRACSSDARYNERKFGIMHEVYQTKELPDPAARPNRGAPCGGRCVRLPVVTNPQVTAHK